MSAYCIFSHFERDLIDVLVDNERFSHSEATAICDVKTCVDGGHLLFIYGEREKEKPELLYECVLNGCSAAALKAHSRLWDNRIAAMVAMPPLARAFTIATYNLLHPTYAEKYCEREGVDVEGKSNWVLRQPYIAAMLSRIQLDVYLLQEVDEAQMEQLGLDEDYFVHHCTHPNREAGDGVAVLLHKSRFIITEVAIVPFDAKQDEYRGDHYMGAAAVFAVHTETGVRFAFCSVHFYPKKSLNPQVTLEAFLTNRKADYDAVVWGGDCNNVYTNPPGDYQWEDRSTHRATRAVSGKKLDWLFCSNNCSIQRSDVTEVFVKASRDLLPETGHAPSDHFAEAAVVICTVVPPLPQLHMLSGSSSDNKKGDKPETANMKAD